MSKIADIIPDAKSFSPRSLQYMKRFYELVPAVSENLPQPAAESKTDSGNQNLPQLAANPSVAAQPKPQDSLLAIPWERIRLLIDKAEAQYALESCCQPVGVPSYELSKLIPEDFKGSLSTIEEIEAELEGNE